jgi:hypothetical protein
MLAKQAGTLGLHAASSSSRALALPHVLVTRNIIRVFSYEDRPSPELGGFFITEFSK